MTSKQATAQRGEVILSAKQKALLYRNQQYTLNQVPPVPTTNWSEQDWIHYVDQNGMWWGN